MRELTTTSLGKLNKSQRSIVGWHGLKGNITMPLSRLLIFGAQLIRLGPLVELVVLDGANRADFRVTSA